MTPEQSGGRKRLTIGVRGQVSELQRKRLRESASKEAVTTMARPPTISEAVWSAMTPEVRHSVAAAIRRAVTHAASQNKRSNPLPMISGSESNYSDESQDSDTEDSAEEQSGDDSLVIVTLHLLRFER